jgi:nucleoside-diphosphate-sugar epimerase
MTKGDQVRDFTSVHLVAQQLLSACAREDLYPGQPIVANIGSGLPQTLLGFAEREWEGMKAMGRLLPGALPKRTDEPSHFVPDLSEIRL